MKISDKLVKVNDQFQIYMYDNGYMVEIAGKSSDDEWITSKIICSDVESILTLVKEAVSLPRND